jgi:hypothetical protein
MLCRMQLLAHLDKLEERPVVSLADAQLLGINRLSHCYTLYIYFHSLDIQFSLFLSRPDSQNE